MDVVQFSDTVNDALDEEQRRRFVRRVLLWLLVFVVVVAAAGGLFYFFYKRNQDRNDAGTGTDSTADQGPGPGPGPGEGPSPGADGGTSTNTGEGEGEDGSGSGSGDTNWGLVIGSSVGGLAALVAGGVWYAHSRNERKIEERPRIRVTHRLKHAPGKGGKGKAAGVFDVEITRKSGDNPEVDRERLEEGLEGMRKDVEGGTYAQKIAKFQDRAREEGPGESTVAGKSFILASIPDNAPEDVIKFIIEVQAAFIAAEEERDGWGIAFITRTAHLMEEAEGFGIEEDPGKERDLSEEEKKYRKEQRERMLKVLESFHQTRLIALVMEYMERRAKKEGTQEDLRGRLSVIFLNTGESVYLDEDGVYKTEQDDDDNRTRFISMRNFLERYLKVVSHIKEGELAKLNFERMKHKAFEALGMNAHGRLTPQQRQELEEQWAEDEKEEKRNAAEAFFRSVSEDLRELYALEEIEKDRFDWTPASKKKERVQAEKEKVKRKMYASLVDFYDKFVASLDGDAKSIIRDVHESMKESMRGSRRPEMRGLTVLKSMKRDAFGSVSVTAEEDAERFMKLIEYFRKRSQGQSHEEAKIKGFDRTKEFEGVNLPGGSVRRFS